MAECIHEMPSGQCSFCSGRETMFVPAQPIKVERRKVRARKAPDMVIAERVARGELCELCLGETAPIGCNCSRAQHFAEQYGRVGAGTQGSEANAGLVQLWLKANVDSFMPANTTDAARAIRSAEKVVTGLAFSTLNRAGRRAGVVRDAEAETGMSELGNLRVDAVKRFDVQPEWHPARTQEADYSPV